jgi:YidC/Oxa1 family membrane protein insertase
MPSALSTLGALVMAPFYAVISALLVGWYRLLTDVLALDPAGGLAWLLAIVGLTVVVRAALLPLFLRQLHSTRALQALQPRVQELQRRHGHDRERLARETMELYRESGTSPFASCLPMLVQVPVFLALFRLVDHAANGGTGHALLTDTLAARLGDAVLLGHLPLSATFLHPGGHLGVQLLAGALVLVMIASTYLTQRLAPTPTTTAPALPAQQRTLLTVLPVVFAVGGIAFPLGVLVYWATSNLWTLGQSAYARRLREAAAPA